MFNIKMISKRYHTNERITVRHRNTLVFATNTLNQIAANSKNKTLVSFFGCFWDLWKLLVTVNNSACSQCLFLLQNAHRKNGLQQSGDMFTF